MQRLSESRLYKAKGSGFTLIELLIVVAIIAILAAIAVPNFLEAQTRAKVTRAASDMRTIRTGLESYRIDANKYPETDYGAGVSSGQAGAGMDRITTPISYLSSVPPSPFKEENIGGNQPKNRHCNIRKVYLYLRAEIATAPIANSYSPTPGNPASFDQSYQSDRRYYALHGSTNIGQINANAVKGHWALKSVGPNNVDDVHTIGVSNARSYDPTNGTTSAGDLVIFSDVSGFAGQ